MIPERNHPANPITILVLQGLFCCFYTGQVQAYTLAFGQMLVPVQKTPYSPDIWQVTGLDACQCRNSIRARLIAGKPVQKICHSGGKNNPTF